MNHTGRSKIRLRRGLHLRWEMAAIVLVVAIILVVLVFQEQREPLASPVVVFTLLALLLLALVGFWVVQARALARQLGVTQRALSRTQRRMDAAFRLSNRFASVECEQEAIQALLRMCAEVIGARGASFVPLDERQQPLSAVTMGYLPDPVRQEWVEHVASPAVRHTCAACADLNADLSHTCPLLPAPFEGTTRLLCVPLRRGERDLGILNLYLGSENGLDKDNQAFLNAMMDDMAVAVEAIRLRQRELTTLRTLGTVHHQDQMALLPALLENLARAVGADFASLLLDAPGTGTPPARLQWGVLPAGNWGHLDPLLQESRTSGRLLRQRPGEQANGLPPEVGTLVVVPIAGLQETCLGSLLVGAQDPDGLDPRHEALLQAVADHIGLLARYTRLAGEVEYQAVMAERTRLAREIHDGLAQTLGFLKLMATQIEHLLARGEFEHLQDVVHEYRATLAEAYLEARQAIDGLRISPDPGLVAWLEETAGVYEDIYEIPLSLDLQVGEVALPPEIQAQMIRIVQEALNNARKHAHASQVCVTCVVADGLLTVEIRDDGLGFEPQAVVPAARHGLQGMRERAALIGAALEIASRPGEGTTVRVQVPAKVGERVA